MRAFWIDEDFDRDHASGSRFDERVEGSVAEFAEAWGDISPVGFACFAWRLAIPPRLDPGYVRWHRRVIAATCDRNTWDGGLTAWVTIVSPWPAELTWSKQWGRDRGWHGWPEIFGQYVAPGDRDTARNPHLTASLTVAAPVPLGGMPMPPDRPTDDLARRARRCVSVVVRELNSLLEPVLAQLDAGVVRPDGRAGAEKS